MEESEVWSAVHIREPRSQLVRMTAFQVRTTTTLTDHRVSFQMLLVPNACQSNLLVPNACQSNLLVPNACQSNLLFPNACQSNLLVPNACQSNLLVPNACQSNWAARLADGQHQKEPEHQGDVSPVPSCWAARLADGQHQKEPEHQGDVSPVPFCGVLKSPLGEVLQPVKRNFFNKTLILTE